MVTALAWEESFRIISARLPRITIFEQICAPSELQDILAIEALTNPRIRSQIGNLGLVPAEQIVTGPGCSFIMAAFTYPTVSRFSNGAYGVYYAANNEATAVAETTYHRERFWKRTATPAMDFDMRVIGARIAGDFEDVRPLPLTHSMYDAGSYAASQSFGAGIHERNGTGIVYTSVRRNEGQCTAIFDTRGINTARTLRYLSYRWDGTSIIDIAGKASLSNDYPDEPAIS